MPIYFLFYLCQYLSMMHRETHILRLPLPYSFVTLGDSGKISRLSSTHETLPGALRAEQVLEPLVFAQRVKRVSVVQ